MKKFLNAMLAVLLCLGLVACGGTDSSSGSNDNNETSGPTEIVITTDNWNDYFEIKDRTYINPMGEPRPDTVFAIKDGYTVTSINVTVKFNYLQEWRYVEIDNEAQTVTVGEVNPDRESESKTGERVIAGFSDEHGNIEVSLQDGWSSNTKGDITDMTICSQFEITSIEGTITLSE